MGVGSVAVARAPCFPSGLEAGNTRDTGKVFDGTVKTSICLHMSLLLHTLFLPPQLTRVSCGLLGSGGAGQ